MELSKKSTRESFGEALKEIGDENDKIVVLDADLSKSTKTAVFKSAHPDHFFNCGISECNMISTAAGFAACGFIPFAASFAMFSAGRAFEQVRNSVSYPKLNVKIVGSHGGITVGEDGASHQCCEDIALMRSLPGMVVLNPCDNIEMREAVKAVADYKGPCYIRLSRYPVYDIHSSNYKFDLHKGETVKDGSDITIIATGICVLESLKAADRLKDDGVSVRVINIHTIKPLDTELILKASKETSGIFTVEEHSIIGGLGEAVSSFLSEFNPTLIKRIGINDVFGQSGTASELLKYYKIDADGIYDAIHSSLQFD